MSNPDDSQSGEKNYSVVLDKLPYRILKISLENEEIWREFHEAGNEMIPSKAGR